MSRLPHHARHRGLALLAAAAALQPVCGALLSTGDPPPSAAATRAFCSAAVFRVPSWPPRTRGGRPGFPPPPAGLSLPSDARPPLFFSARCRAPWAAAPRPAGGGGRSFTGQVRAGSGWRAPAAAEPPAALPTSTITGAGCGLPTRRTPKQRECACTPSASAPAELGDGRVTKRASAGVHGAGRVQADAVIFSAAGASCPSLPRSGRSVRRDDHGLIRRARRA
jgi:hypothetical protein